MLRKEEEWIEKENLLISSLLKVICFMCVRACVCIHVHEYNGVCVCVHVCIVCVYCVCVCKTYKGQPCGVCSLLALFSGL